MVSDFVCKLMTFFFFSSPVTEGLHGLCCRLLDVVWRLTTDGVNLHPGEPDICQAAGMTPVWCIQLVVTQPRKGIILLMKSGTFAASLPAAQTNLKLDQISPYYISHA